MMAQYDKLLAFFAPLVLVLTGMLILSNSALGYRLATDKQAGGNYKLAKMTYNVYIQANPVNPEWRDEVESAVYKWKTELAIYGVDLQIQAGNPPNNPIDSKAYDVEMKKYKEEGYPDLPDPIKYPEITTLNAKQNSISIYWDTKENIQKRGISDTAGGLAENYYSFDQNEKASTIDVSDIFIPKDPIGGTSDVKIVQIHNISMHELAHPAGFDHYTKTQNDKGQVMQPDASTFSDRINILVEDKDGLKNIYDVQPQLKIDSNAEKKKVNELPDKIRNSIPPELVDIWEYSYTLTWEGGGLASYFQVETGSCPVYAAQGYDGLSKWLVELPGKDEGYVEFYGDSNYLGDSDTKTGKLSLYSPYGPGKRWLVHAGGAERGIAPIPEPSTIIFLAFGCVVYCWCMKKIQ